MFLNFILIYQQIRGISIIQDVLSLDQFQLSWVIRDSILNGNLESELICKLIVILNYWITSIYLINGRKYKHMNTKFKIKQLMHSKVFIIIKLPSKRNFELMRKTIIIIRYFNETKETKRKIILKINRRCCQIGLDEIYYNCYKLK